MAKQTDIMKPQSPPKLLRKTPTLTAIELFRSAWADDKMRSKDQAVKSVKTGSVKKSAIFHDETPFYRVHVRNKLNQHIHMVTVFLHDNTQKFTAKSKVLVDCTCPQHVYTYEYALAKKGNAMIWRCNGNRPVQTNPRMTVGICKHSVIALRYLIREAKAGTLVQKSRQPVKLSLKRG